MRLLSWKMLRRLIAVSNTAGVSLLILATPGVAVDHPWRNGGVSETLLDRFAAPSGYLRLPVAEGSFASWLRHLPLRSGRPDVLLFSGRKKSDQGAHLAVVDVDVGRYDLQQCADAVIRLRAEYLLSRGCESEISFNFTSGDPASWSEWKKGMRPVVSGNRVSWSRASAPDSSYASFRSFLDVVFTYAGSISLSKELRAVSDPSLVESGDVFIQGGSPGHAVLVVDVAQNPEGERVFLLVQSYMPAQDIHVLRNPGSSASPWYPARPEGDLVTPEWRFQYQDLKRFPSSSCAG